MDDVRRDQSRDRSDVPAAAGGDGGHTGANACPGCGGSGHTDGGPCPTCRGTGLVEEPIGDA